MFFLVGSVRALRLLGAFKVIRVVKGFKVVRGGHFGVKL